MKKWNKRIPKREFDIFDDILTQLAAVRGIDDLDDFLSPSHRHLHSPYLLGNIEVVRDKIVEAIKNHKNISVYFDVDNDGCVSGAEMVNFLKCFTDNVQYFHAQRSSGHGVENSIADIPEGTQLLIIVDSSTSSVEACKYLSEKGIDICILDHHPSSEQNPYASIVNPQLCDYPNKYLSGAAVVWKVCQVLDDYFSTNYSSNMIDLVGIGLLGDQMSMLEMENRHIVHHALDSIRNFGIKSLLKCAKKNVTGLTSTDILFSIVPIINACTRLDKLEVIAELLTCTDETRCLELAKEAVKLNELRKVEQSRFVSKLRPLADETNKILIFIDDEIGKGYNGLVANDLANAFHRPVLVLNRDGDYLQGSFRSYNNYPLKDFLNTIHDIDFSAGHQCAGGVGFYVDKLETIQKEMNDRLADEFKEYVLEYDIDLHVDEITKKLIQQVEKFNRITGEGFTSALFRVDGLSIHQKTIYEKQNTTLKASCNGVELVKFKASKQQTEYMPEQGSVEVVGGLSINSWYNFGKKKTVETQQILLEDFRVVG